VTGLLEDFRQRGIVALQYADDTILFSKAEESVLENLKCILMWYEQISGMRINFHKSEMIPINLGDHEVHSLAHILSCPVGKFPIKYLGIPLHFDALTRDDIQPLVDKIMNKIAGWRGKLMSLAARVVLIKSCLSSIPVYLLSFIKFPKWVIKMLNTHMANFLWDDCENNHRYHLANWELVSMHKDFGGLGIPNLRDLNLCLLASWLKRYNVDRDKLWKELIDFKYDTLNPHVLLTRTSNASSFLRVLCGQHSLLRWGICGRLEMGGKLGFGRTLG